MRESFFAYTFVFISLFETEPYFLLYSIRQLLKGDEKLHAQSEMNRVVEQYASTLLRTAYSFLKNKDDAEDAVQDAFIRYMEKAPDFDSPSHEKAWLLRVTINVCKNHMASSWFRKRAELSEDIPALEPEEKTVLETVLKLPQKYRSVIHLYYYEGYSRLSRALKQPAQPGCFNALYPPSRPG